MNHQAYGYKLNKEDNVKVVYCNYYFRVVAVEWTGRSPTDWNSRDQIITLENGKRLVSAHFKYGLATKVGSDYSWALSLHYTYSRLKHCFDYDNPLLSNIRNYPKWNGATLLIPITYNPPTT
jgi:hypothetical protein